MNGSRFAPTTTRPGRADRKLAIRLLPAPLPDPIRRMRAGTWPHGSLGLADVSGSLVGARNLNGTCEQRSSMFDPGDPPLRDRDVKTCPALRTRRTDEIDSLRLNQPAKSRRLAWMGKWRNEVPASGLLTVRFGKQREPDVIASSGVCQQPKRPNLVLTVWALTCAAAGLPPAPPSPAPAAAPPPLAA